MRVAIHQPEYFSWLGYYDKLLRADLFVVLDTVQFDRGVLQHRAKILNANGEPSWLTIPIAHGKGGVPIKCTPIVRTQRPRDSWATEHLRRLVGAYYHAPHFKDVMALLADSGVFDADAAKLGPVVNRSVRFMARVLGVEHRLRVASLSPPFDGAKSELNLNICRHFGATVYLSGRSGALYLDRAAWAYAGIAIEVQEYRHPVYPQVNERLHADVNQAFAANLSVLDLLFNCGWGESARLLKEAATR